MQAVREQALRLLGVRSRSVEELRRRLREKHPADLVDSLLRRFQETGLLDDERFACERARAVARGRGWGPRKVRADLFRRGLRADLIDRAVAEAYGDLDMAALMRRLIAKRFGQEVLLDESPAALRGKAQRFLLGRGFESGQVRDLFGSG
jgi:regulatory protein